MATKIWRQIIVAFLEKLNFKIQVWNWNIVFLKGSSVMQDFFRSKHDLYGPLVMIIFS